MKRSIVVVTGASGCVGSAVASEFARHGWGVVLLARGEAALRLASDEVLRVGGDALAIPTDVTQFDQVVAAAARVEREWGPIDVWINDAMALQVIGSAGFVDDDFRRINETSYMGSVWGTLAALRCMKPRNRGTIMQVGSTLADLALPLPAAYHGAKSALRGFVDALRGELVRQRSRVRFTLVNVPAVNAPPFDLRSAHLQQGGPRSPGFPCDVGARSIYWAAHHSRRELWVSWPGAVPFRSASPSRMIRNVPSGTVRVAANAR